MSNMERIVFIDRRIRESGGLRLAEVAERFEVSERQAKRDIEHLRNRLDAPLVWEAERRRYVYEESWPGLAFADEKALLFYVFARAAAGTLAYVPLAEAGALEHLLELVPPALRGLEAAVRYELPGFEPVEGERLALILGAIRDKRELLGAYRDLEGRESERLLSPRRIVNYAGTWYCLAYDPGLAELRTFRLSRFARLSPAPAHPPLGAEARGPEEPEVERFLEASYGMFKGPADKRALLRFRGRAREILRGEIWHPEQTRREARDAEGRDYLELELPVSQWDEILGRLLRFGAEAEAVSPPEFRERWLSSIDALTELARQARSSP